MISLNMPWFYAISGGIVTHFITIGQIITISINNIYNQLMNYILLSLILLVSNCRRLSHLAQELPTPETTPNIQEVEKKIFREVLTDKDITPFIIDGKTNTPDFKKTIIKKTLSVIAHNDQYLNSLSTKVFSDSKINLNDQQKSKVLKIALSDDKLTTLIAEKSDKNQIIKRASQLISEDKSLFQEIANSIFRDNELGKQLSDEQKVALFKIYLNKPQSMQKQGLSQEGIKDITNLISNDASLKDFYNTHKDQFVQKLVKKI